VIYCFDTGVVDVEGGRWTYGSDQVCSGEEWDEHCPLPSITALLIGTGNVSLLVDGGDDEKFYFLHSSHHRVLSVNYYLFNIMFCALDSWMQHGFE